LGAKNAVSNFVARKLLLLIYTIWKNDTEYISDYGHPTLFWDQPCLRK